MSRIVIFIVFLGVCYTSLLHGQNKQTLNIQGTISAFHQNEKHLFDNECGTDVLMIAVDFKIKDAISTYITSISVDWNHTSNFVYKGKKYYISEYGPIKIKCRFTFKVDIELDGKFVEHKQFGLLQTMKNRTITAMEMIFILLFPKKI
jgi:hypothetical protein